MRTTDPPVRAVAGNLVVSRSFDDVWAVYRLFGQSYRAEARRRQQRVVGDLERYCASARADFQILCVSKPWDADSYITGLQSDPPPRAHRDLWDAYLEDQRGRLEATEDSMLASFLCVRLAEPQRDLHAQMSEVLDLGLADARDRLRATVASRRGVAQGALNVEMFTPLADAAERRIRSCLDVRPASEEEVQWLVRRVFGRGFGEPRIVPAKTLRLPWQQRVRSMEMWLDDVMVGPRHGHLELTDGFATTFQAGVCLGELGDSTPFSRECELMFTALEEFSFPVDASLNVRWVPSDTAKRQSKTQFGKNKTQMIEADESDMGAMDDEIDDVHRARELHGRVSQTKEPVLFGTLTLSVVADTLQELSARVTALREELPHEWYRPKPRADQLAVAYSHFPGQLSRVSGYERMFTCEQIGAMVPHATYRAGSDSSKAIYIARTQHGNPPKPVFAHLSEAWEANLAPTIALLGALGRGKTMAMQTLLYQAFLQGFWIVDADPKNDHKWHTLPEVADCVSEIVLGPDPIYRGKLDPLRVAPDNERHTAAATFLVDVTGTTDALHRAAIHGAIGRVIDRDKERACCTEVIAQLNAGDSQVERDAGEMLSHYASGGIVGLGFGRRDDPLPQQAVRQVTYLNVRALDAPMVQTVRSEMSLGELHGRAVMQLVALYSMRILGREKARAKMLAFDETSFIRSVGKRLLDQLCRWGRSEKALAILSTQLVDDVSAQDGLIGSWYQFGMDSRTQAQQALEALELDPDGPLLAALTQRYGKRAPDKGKCIHRDLQGRAEEIQWDPGPRLVRELDTTAAADVPSTLQAA